MHQSQEVIIHPTAIVDPKAQLGKQVTIDAYAIIGPDVELEDGVTVGSHAILSGRTKIGAETKIWPFCSIGTHPQDLKYRGEPTELDIGRGNMIREYVNISIGTEGGGGKTVIGDQNLIMVYTHIAHDVQMGNQCIIANSVQLAGHVIIDNNVVIGGASAVHQFCRLGQLAMVAGGGMVAMDVPPFCMVHGNRAAINGLNVVGLRRSGTNASQLRQIKSLFRLIYQETSTISEAIEKLEDSKAESSYHKIFLDFLRQSERGICR